MVFPASPTDPDGGGGGVTDHGALTGLGDNDHTIYARRAQDLADLNDAPTARTNLGLGTAAQSDVADFATGAEGDLATSAVQPGDGTDQLNAPAFDGNLSPASSADLSTVLQLIDDLTLGTDPLAAVFVYLWDGDSYEIANSGSVPAGAPRMFFGPTDPESVAGGEFTTADGDQWIDTDATPTFDAENVTVETTDFDGILSGTDDDVQAALGAIDDHTHAAVTEFDDSTFRVQDNADDTKEIAFQASAITTATTRTITMPDADVDLGDISPAVAQGQAILQGQVYG